MTLGRTCLYFEKTQNRTYSFRYHSLTRDQYSWAMPVEQIATRREGVKRPNRNSALAATFLDGEIVVDASVPNVTHLY